MAKRQSNKNKKTPIAEKFVDAGAKILESVLPDMPKGRKKSTRSTSKAKRGVAGRKSSAIRGRKSTGRKASSGRKSSARRAA